MEVRLESIDVGTRSLDVELFVPERAGPHAAVLLLHEAFGLDSHVRADARSLCRAGYVVLAPNLYTDGAARYCIKLLFSADALANRATARPNLEVGRCLDWLRDHPDTNGKLGMIGMCLTGGFVLQMARREDMLAPVVFHHSFGQFGAGLPKADCDDIEHTVLGHFAEHDVRMCPKSRVAALSRELGDRLDVRWHQGVGHGLRSAFRHTEAGAASWEQTLAFFAQHLS